MNEIEKLELNLYFPQKAIDQMIEAKINEIIDYINSQNNISDNVEEEKEGEE